MKPESRSDGPPPAIVASNVGKRFGPVVALDDVSLRIERGEVFGLLGPNGSGKTTLMRILAGSLSANSGRLTVGGVDCQRNGLEARRKIGYVPESAPNYGHMRVREFLAFMGQLRGIAKAELPTAIERVIERLSLGEVARKQARTLSRGYRQRLALAQALIHDPEIVILDEPTNGLDPRQIIEVRGLIQELAGRHTVLMSSHILGEVARTAGRVAVLLGGKILGARAVADTPDLEDWFLSLT